MPIASYMKEYRMKQAANMLLHEDKAISEIAAAVGYKSQSKSFSIVPISPKIAIPLSSINSGSSAYLSLTEI